MSVAFDIRLTSRHPALARDDVRRGLVALLRRRVPAQEVDDLAQTILCDALAAGTMPADEEELRRWLVGIARHKVADYHRRTMRTAARSDGEASLATCTTSPAAFEEREVLHQLVGEVRSRRDAETMEWLVREHGGERLADIADENALPAPVVRQRVSRLRRALRSRWGIAAGLLVLIAGAAAYAYTREAPTAIAPDKPVQTVEQPAKPPAPDPIQLLVNDIQGDWLISSYQSVRSAPAMTDKFQQLLGSHPKVHIEDRRITVSAKGMKESWAITGVDGEYFVLTSDHGLEDRAKVTVRQSRGSTFIDLGIVDRPWLPATISLQRPIY